MKFNLLLLLLSSLNLSLAIPSIFNLQNFFQNSDNVITSPLSPAETESSSYSSSYRAKNHHAPVSVEANFAAKGEEIETKGNGGKKFHKQWIDRLINGIQTPLNNNLAPIEEEVIHPSVPDTSQYEDDVVLRFSFSSRRDLKAFKYAAETLLLDIWLINKNFGDIRISKSRIRDLLKLLPKSIRNNQIEIISDLQMAVFSTYPLKSKNSNKENILDDEIFFNDYRNFNQINVWIDSLPLKYNNESNKLVSIESIGLTHEGRPIKLVHLSKQMIKPKSTIIVISGVQGREWSSIMSGLFSISNVIKDGHLLDKFDFLFIPILNPDGFVYTWENDRLWRKNRQPTSMSICSGIDIDHSFPNHWQQTVESTPCSETYGGLKANEALESLHLSNYLNITNKQIQGYLQFGSYSQSILYPRGKNKEEYQESLDFAEDLVSTINLETSFPSHNEVTSTTTSTTATIDYSYLSTSISQLTLDSTNNQKTSGNFSIGELSIHRDGSRGGSNVDLMKSKGIPSLQITLPDYDNSGYLLPKKYIPSSSKEMHKVLNNYCELLSINN